MQIKKKLSILILISISFATFCSPPGYMSKRRSMFNIDDREKIVRTAIRYLGVKYKNRGATPWGFDCSGFVMFVYGKNGIMIPRTAQAQFRSGRNINIKNAVPGDLVFFKISRKRISHVGIYLGNYRFIHSPSTGKKVSYASIKNPYWNKRYIGAVTFFKHSNYSSRILNNMQKKVNHVNIAEYTALSEEQGITIHTF